MDKKTSATTDGAPQSLPEAPVTRLIELDEKSPGTLKLAIFSRI
jgi:hypothetical protein